MDRWVMRTGSPADLALASQRVITRRGPYITKLAPNAKMASRVICHPLQGHVALSTFVELGKCLGTLSPFYVGTVALGDCKCRRKVATQASGVGIGIYPRTHGNDVFVFSEGSVLDAASSRLTYPVSFRDGCLC